MGDSVIRVSGLTKRYRIGQRTRYKTARESVARLAERFHRAAVKTAVAPGPQTFLALDDVNFDVDRGEVLGIIGRNGAGKSTLLKVLSRITEPTAGRIEIEGRIGTLLEVGTGFHPELTGRENVFLNGAILGMRRTEIQAKFDEIVDFAGVDKFLDTPVKHYSSGMYMRLAFAVAAHLEPEILVVDEVLAVGDAEFQAKCLGKMSEVARQGRTVLFVSHQLNAIETLCSKVIRLQSGKIIDSGGARDVIARYLAVEHSQSEWLRPSVDSANTDNEYFTPTRLAAVDAEGKPLTVPAAANTGVRIVIEGTVENEQKALTVGFALYAKGGELLFWTLATDGTSDQWPRLDPGKHALACTIPPHFLNEGDYRVDLILSLHNLKWLAEPGVNAPGVSFTIKGGLSDSPYWMEARPGLLAPILAFNKCN